MEAVVQHVGVDPDPADRVVRARLDGGLRGAGLGVPEDRRVVGGQAISSSTSWRPASTGRRDHLDAVRGVRDRGQTVILLELDMKWSWTSVRPCSCWDGEKLAEARPAAIQSDERVIAADFGR
jgi:hypothetical protein